MNDHKLRCEDVRDGLFSNERIITVQELGNGKVDFVVPSDYVDKNTVRVRVFESSGNSWVVIPTEYQESIPVDRNLLEPA